jgi:probable rRNA maturation factor
VSEVAVSGRRLPISRSLVQRVVRTVLRRERRDALISVTFLGRDSMRRLNAEHIVGDVYICPWMARQEAKARGISLREELIRLIVHGTLHALGRDHPEGPERTRSAMWRRQERYVEALA